MPKTPAWAAEITGVPARTIEALAHEWAAKKTTVMGCGMGGACRTAYGHEYARLVVLLQAMQGLGQAGDQPLGQRHRSARRTTASFFPGYADLDAMMSFSRAAERKAINPVEQRLYRLLLADSILDPPVKWTGEGFCGQKLEQQFAEFVYPMPGYPEVRMLYRYGAASLGTMTEGNKLVKMFQSPKLETVVVQDCWWHTETRFADVILPACTNFERNDIAEWGEAGGYLKWGTTGLQLPGHHATSRNASSRWANRGRTTGSSPSSPSDWGCGTSSRTAASRKRIGSGPTSTSATCPSTSPGRTSSRRATTWSRCRSRTSPPPPFAGSTRGGTATRPDVMNPNKGTERASQLATPSGKIEFVSGSLTHVHSGRRGEATRAPLHPQLGRPRIRVGREIPAADDLAPPPLLLPQPLRQEGLVDQRHPRPPPTHQRLLLLDGEDQPGRRGGAGHQGRRRRAALQRSRLGSRGGDGHGAHQAGGHPQLLLLRQVRPGRTGQGRTRSTAVAASTCSPPTG